jgi:hypothetical protein
MAGVRIYAYQAWRAPQCGQLTLVETGAMKK